MNRFSGITGYSGGEAHPAHHREWQLNDDTPLAVAPPRGKKTVRRSAALTASVITAGLLLSACGSGITGNNFSEEDADTGANTASGEPAVAKDSPAEHSDLPGKRVEIDGLADHEFTAAARVGLEGNDDSIAVLLPGELLILNATKLDKPRHVEVSDSCRNVNTSAQGVAVACDGEVLEFDPQGEKLRTLTVDGNAKTATFTNEGRATVGLEGSDRVHFFDHDGNKSDDEIVSRSIDQAVLVQPAAGEDGATAQRVAVIDEGQTSVTDVDPSKDVSTAALRIGQGVGQINSGGGADGVLIASDNKQDQMLLYTMNDLVRLHQTVPTGDSPWATMWDSKEHVAWVSTTGDNKLSAYKVAAGAPRLVAQLDTIANVRSVFSTTDGGLIIVGKDGLVQQISAKDIQAAKDAGVPDQEEIGEKYLGGQS